MKVRDFRGRRPFTLRIVSFLLAALVLIGGSAAHAETRPSTGPVMTDAGRVQGISAEGVAEFLGIPYAKPPVGALRWQPPAPADRFADVWQATKFQNFCPALQRGVFASPSTTEDCLYLNVFTPGLRGKRPVMVWFYGGGLYSGESNDYDGSKLARLGDVVVVTLNYRVGALGFFSHPAINGEGHAYANYGLMDQQFALLWVKSNIAAFGGDPNNVTIFGQSGGATAVMANLASPTAKGLFQKAINESGTHINRYTPATALKVAQEFAVAAGCGDQSAACLRGLSVEQVLQHQGPIVAHVANEFPIADGTIIVDTAWDAFQRGAFNRVPILTGLVRDEQAFFLPELNSGVVLTAAEFDRYATSFGEAHVAALKERYPVASYPSVSLAEIDMAQGFKVCTARLLDRTWSDYVPVFAYQFNDRLAPSYFAPPSYPMRAYHTSELQFLFPMFHGGQGVPHRLSAKQEVLSERMIAYWASFARTGVPKGWPRYMPRQDNVLLLDEPAIAMKRDYGSDYDCGLWDQIIPEAL